MADFVFNIAKGRVVEYYNRVKANDPTNSALIIVAIDANGDTDATMKDRDDLAALLGGTANEVTNTNYARKVLTDADLAALPAPDDTNDRLSAILSPWPAVDREHQYIRHRDLFILHAVYERQRYDRSRIRFHL